MCGRYWIDDGRESIELGGIIEAVNRRAPSGTLKTSGEVFPGDLAPVVASNRRMARDAFAMRWGYALPNGRRVFNARSETAQARPLFADGMRRRRCAVPATHYFEWERLGNRTGPKHAIRPAGDGLFYMAGIYRIESGAPEFSILTREAAAGIAFIHDRMPVILPEDLVSEWIDPRADATELLRHAVVDVVHARDSFPIGKEP